MTMVVTGSLSSPLSVAAKTGRSSRHASAAVANTLDMLGNAKIGCAAILPRKVAGFLSFRRRDLSGEFALRPIANANAHLLPLLQFAHTGTTQHFHMHKDVGRIGSTRHEAIALAAVEPFDRRLERRSLRCNVVTTRPLRRLRVLRRHGIVQQQKTPRLKTLWSLHRFADHMRAFLRVF